MDPSIKETSKQYPLEQRENWSEKINNFLNQQIGEESKYLKLQSLDESKDFGRLLIDEFITSLRHQDASLFTNYLHWTESVFGSRDIPVPYIEQVLGKLENLIEKDIPDDQRRPIRSHLEKAKNQWKNREVQSESHINSDTYLGSLARSYIDALLKADRKKARDLIIDAVEEDKVPIKDIYTNVFQVVQYEIGRLWQLNEISVAQEHFATAATQMVMSQLYPYIFREEKSGYRLVAASVGSELHEIGIRMVADFFEIEGWDTYYLGANMPAEDLIDEMKQILPHVLSISATMTHNIEQTEQLIHLVRKEEDLERVKIMVGGYPFQLSEDLWKQVGADGFASDAREAVDLAKKLVQKE